MARVLTINPGTSSLKLSIVDSGRAEWGLSLQDWDGTLSPDWLVQQLAGTDRIDLVGARIVHGGDRAGPAVLDGAALDELAELDPLAPLHQPVCLAMAETAMAAFPGIPVVGGFDTAFHAGLPEHAATFPLPAGWRADYHLVRAGFHGLSCGYALRRGAGLLAADPGKLSLVCCHIGSGVSVTAIAGGRSVDTSMGLTPLDGAAMATRSGAVDPGLLLYLLRNTPLTVADLAHGLNHDAGLAGLSHTDGDMRSVLAARHRGDADADLAVRVYLHRLRREIGAALVSVGEPDAIVLTGGVAEHQPGLRAELLADLGSSGIAVDLKRNASATGDAVISPRGARPAVLSIHAREDLQLAAEAERAVAAPVAGATR